METRPGLVLTGVDVLRGDWAVTDGVRSVVVCASDFPSRFDRLPAEEARQPNLDEQVEDGSSWMQVCDEMKRRRKRQC